MAGDCDSQNVRRLKTRSLSAVSDSSTNQSPIRRLQRRTTSNLSAASESSGVEERSQPVKQKRRSTAERNKVTNLENLSNVNISEDEEEPSGKLYFLYNRLFV